VIVDLEGLSARAAVVEATGPLVLGLGKLMSELGHSRRIDRAPFTSGLP
jgi:hypothetical protein